MVSDFYEYMSDPGHYEDDTMRRDFECGVLERADAEDRERDLTDWPAPDEERRVSQFDTVEEDRGER